LSWTPARGYPFYGRAGDASRRAMGSKTSELNGAQWKMVVFLREVLEIEQTQGGLKS